MTHPACQRAAVSHCISPSSPISRRRGDDTRTVSAGSRPCFPFLCRTDAAASQQCQNRKGWWLPGGSRDQRAAVLELDLYHWSGEKNQGVSIPQALLCHAALLYQMVKSRGTGFSFPPKLDKLKSNELVKGKINPVHSFQKAPPFTDFLSENITDVTCCGTWTILEAQDWLRIKSWTHPAALVLCRSGCCHTCCFLNYSSLCASRKAKVNTSWT